MTANSKRGVFDIMLDRPRKVQLTFNAMALVEETLGISYVTTPNPFTCGARGLRALLYAGLKKDDPLITLEQAGDFFDEFESDYISGILMKAWLSAQGVDPDAPKNVQGPDGTGTQS